MRAVKVVLDGQARCHVAPLKGRCQSFMLNVLVFCSVLLNLQDILVDHICSPSLLNKTKSIYIIGVSRYAVTFILF